MNQFNTKKKNLIAISAFILMIMIAACNTTKSIQKSENETIDEAFLQDFARTKDLSTGTIPRERLLVAIQRQNDIFANHNSQRAVPGIAWQERGPNNVAGRIRAVMIDKNDASNKKVFVGGVGGGIWYTNDITATVPIWNKVNDFLDNMAITDIIQDPTTPMTMYASTGEGFMGGGAQKGLGIFKSTDGGNSWTGLASTSTFEFVQDLEFDKNNKLYASVRSSTAALTGIMRSSDGGTTWVQVLSTTTTTASSSDRGCDIKISKDGDLYASLGIFDNGGIYKSPLGATVGDAGTWTNITPSTAGVIEVPNNKWNRIKLATSPSDNNVLYAVMQGGSTGDQTYKNACAGIQQYNASLNTWAVRTVPKIIDQNSSVASYPVFTREGNGGQAWYDLVAAVDPNNAAILVVSGIDACKSTDNGATWNQISVWTANSNELAAGFTGNQVVHADHHNFIFVAGSSATAILANDGGIYYSNNINVGSNKPTYVTKNTGLNITQLYAAAISPTAGADYFLDGTQDNGSHKFTGTGLNNTTNVSGGDGGFCHISPINADHQISSYTNNNYYISTNGGTTFPSGNANNGRGSFINPTDYDGNNLYGGDDAGSFFRWTNPQGNTATGTAQVVASFGTANITHVSISKITANRVYFGLNDGKVVQVSDANTTNTGVIIGTPRVGSVSCIASTPTNEDSLLVSYSNYGGSKIYVSANGTNAAATFADVTGNLPDMPVRWVMFDPRSSKMVIAATELGVWSCDDITVATPQWTITSSGLARVRVDMLKYRSNDRTLLAATHGRGLFSSKIPTNLNPEVNFNIGSLNIAEQKSITANTCVNYTDYPAAIIINGAPSADATVTITVAGSPASEGKHFDILVNNVKSKIVVIPSGTTDSKPFTIRVYADGVAGNTETITLNFSTTGGGSSIGTSNASLAVNITDKDEAIAAPTTVATNAIGSTASPINSNKSPFWANNGADANSQMVYLASELTAAGLVAGSNITELSFNITTKNTNVPINNFNIKLGHTTVTPTASTGFLTVSNQISCYSNASYSSVLGDNIFTFTTPFVWDGTSNIIAQYCFDNSTDFLTSQDDVSVVDNVLGTGVRATSIVTADASASLNGCTMPTSGAFYPQTVRMITKFKHYKPGTSIETVAGNTATVFVQSATAEYDLYSSTNKVIAKIKNPNLDLGCVTANLLNDGNGVTTPFFSGNRSSKVWSITPTTNGSTVAYTVTLYMTKAELGGADPSTFKIYKSSAATVAGANMGNTLTAATTVSTNAEFTSFTATFTGFSIFFIGTNTVVLPISYSDFNGVRINNSNNLGWKNTSNSLTKFDVERSLDGVNFSGIGTVNYSTSTGNYNFADNMIYKGIAYYRLKIYLTNGSYSYSYIISLNADKNAQIKIYPSPTKSDVVVSMSDNALLNTYVSVFDNKAVMVKTILLKDLQQQVSLKELPTGVYYFRFTNNTVINVIKQ